MAITTFLSGPAQARIRAFLQEYNRRTGATILLTEQHYLKGTYTGSGLGTVQIGTTDSNYPSAVIRVDPTGASFNFGDGLLHFVKGSIYSDNTPGLGYATLTNNGSITIDGVERWISAWIKDGKNGKFMSLSLGKPKEERPAHKVNGPASSDPDLNDDIPF